MNNLNTESADPTEMTLEQFNAWYADPILRLCNEKDGGIAALILSIPLAERYFRQTSDSGQSSKLGDSFYRQIGERLFNLHLDETKKLWQCLRDGLLHQASFNHQSHKVKIYITRKGTGVDNRVRCKEIGQVLEFVVDARALAEKIVKMAQMNFYDVFRAGLSSSHPLLVESEIPGWAEEFLTGEKLAGGTGCP
ncbi:MAG: hypothetical protein K8U03_09355 [Planctomycetia bacterium]|nr:hypothetical protein [Planctomycetia bacterium]